MTASKRGQGRSRILLLIGISLMFFSWLSRVIAPDLSGAPLLELYEQGMVDLLCGFGGLLGGILTILGSIFLLEQRQKACPECGTPIVQAEDRYCRSCGAQLAP